MCIDLITGYTARWGDNNIENIFYILFFLFLQGRREISENNMIHLKLDGYMHRLIIEDPRPDRLLTLIFMSYAPILRKIDKQRGEKNDETSMKQNHVVGIRAPDI